MWWYLPGAVIEEHFFSPILTRSGQKLYGCSCTCLRLGSVLHVLCGRGWGVVLCDRTNEVFYMYGLLLHDVLPGASTDQVPGLAACSTLFQGSGFHSCPMGGDLRL